MNEITFCFKQATNLRFLDAQQDSALITVDSNKITAAVAHVFDKLIKRNASKYETAIKNLSCFSVTFIHNLEKPSSLVIESQDVVIIVDQLFDETAALFLNSIPKTLEPGVTAQKAIEPPKETIQPPKLDPVEVIAQPFIPVATSSTPIAAKTSTREESTEQEDPSIGILIDMHQRFINTLIWLSETSGKSFGTYLMERLFGKAVSHEYEKETGDFTITFAEEQKFNLTKLPEKVSAQTKKDLTQLLNSILTLPKKVKGKFSENKVSFEPGSLTISWPNGWISTEAQLLEIYEAQNGRITMRVKYGIIPARYTSVLAQDFANFVECNLPK